MNDLTSEKYLPINHCIYCGTSVGKMTDEHIVPLGLQPTGTNWFLPKCSCRDCATITSKVELDCLRGMMGPIRAKLELKSRRKKKATATRIMRNRATGEFSSSDLLLGDFPTFCLGIKLAAPGLVTFRPGDDFVGEVVMKHQPDLPAHLEETMSMFVGTISIDLFARFLAKIAHCYAVAKFGQDSFRPLLQDVILGREVPSANLIGGDVVARLPPPSHTDTLHHIHRIGCSIEGRDYMGSQFSCSR